MKMQMTELKQSRPVKRTVKTRRAPHLPLCFALRPTPSLKKPLWALCSEIIIKTKPGQYTMTSVRDVCRTVLKLSKQPVHQAEVSPAATRDSDSSL